MVSKWRPVCEGTCEFFAQIYNRSSCSEQGEPLGFMLTDVSRSASCRGISTWASECEGQKVSQIFSVYSHPLIFAMTPLLTHSVGSGTLYFTSIRKEKGQPFNICEFWAFSLSSSLHQKPQYDSKLSATTARSSTLMRYLPLFNTTLWKVLY